MHRSPSSLLLLLFLMKGAGAWHLSAADGVLGLSSTPREVPERGRVHGATVQRGGERDSFIVPAGWRLGLSRPEGKVILQSAEYHGTMEMRSLPRSERMPTADELRQQVVGASERAQVQREFIWPGTNAQTLAFDTSDTNQSELPVRRRVLFIIKDRRVIEVSLTARADRFEACQRAFEIVVASLRSH